MLVLHKRSEILDKVKDYVNSFWNLSKINFYDPCRNDFIEVNSVFKVFEELNITKQKYENVLKLSASTTAIH